MPVKRASSMLTQEMVREFFDYEPLTGRFFHKPRDVKWFASWRSCCSWNARWAGKEAFTTQGIGTDGRETYLVGRVIDRVYAAHLIAWLWMTGSFPEGDLEVDHRDRNKKNNRWLNLRDVSKSVNQHNRNGVHGVRERSSGKWEARMRVAGKYVHVGTFTTEKAALDARHKMKTELGLVA